MAWLPMDFLHEGLPEMRLTARHEPPPAGELPPLPQADLGDLVGDLLARPNLASNEQAIELILQSAPFGAFADNAAVEVDAAVAQQGTGIQQNVLRLVFRQSPHGEQA